MRLEKLDLRRWLPILIVLVGLMGLFSVAADWNQMRVTLKLANWRPLPFALAATLVSYACISFSFAQVSRLLGVRMRMRSLAMVGFISSVLNHLMLSGGAAGYSVRFMLMNHHGVTMREVVAISILHFYLTSLAMIGMLPFGLIYLSLNAALSQTATILLVAAALLLLILVALATVLLFAGDLRTKVTDLLAKTVRTLTRRDVSELMERFDTTMSQGIKAMRGHPFTIVLIGGMIVVDWVFSAMTLWFCFRAFDVTLSAGQLISGFVIGTIAGVASLVPGGLGIQEASMTGIFALFGVPFEKAALAAVQFRIVYTIIPYFISLGLYRRALRLAEDGVNAATPEVTHENPVP